MAAPAGAATLTAPVIHETFTVLPCSGKVGARTTLQLEGCAEHQVVAADAKIDALNVKIFALLTSTSQQVAFTTGHNSWLAFRRKFCLSASDIYQGGSYAPVVYINCVDLIDGDHVRDLQDYLAALKPASGAAVRTRSPTG